MSRGSKEAAIQNTAEAWENGELGREAKYAEASPKEVDIQVDKALDLEIISIRLETDLIESFQILGKKYDVSYKPLMRHALKSFIQSQINC
jgi:uncharacterized protein (DUF4415 family)